MTTSEGQFRQSYRGQTGMVETCKKEGRWIYWWKDTQDGATRQEERGEIHGFVERGYADSW